MWRVVTAMLAKGEMDPASFLAGVDDSIHYRLYLGVRSSRQLPSARRIKGFLVERLAPVMEHLVLWFNDGLVSRGGVAMGAEFGTDGLEMAAQARTRSDAVAAHLRPQGAVPDQPVLEPSHRAGPPWGQTTVWANAGVQILRQCCDLL
jgi:hypothetical protein